MGDRGNIVCRFSTGNPKSDVYFYTHWRGSSIGSVVRDALAKKARWDDPAYLARMIFDGLTGCDGGETGFGISLSAHDNEHNIVVVDMERQRVYCVDKAYADSQIPENLTENEGGWTFDEYVTKHDEAPIEE